METAERQRRRSAFLLVRFVLGLALAAFVLEALNGQRNDLAAAVSQLGRLKVEWVVVGVALEVVSYLSLGALQKGLLRAGNVRLTMSFATALALASSAIVSSLPGGPAFAGVYTFGQYRRKGADGAVALWVIIAVIAFEALALSLIASAGVGLAIQEGASYNLIGVTAASLVLFGAIDALVWQRRWLVLMFFRIFSWSHDHFGRPRRDIVIVMDDFLSRLAAVRPGSRDLTRALVIAAAFWIGDCGCLAASFGGVGAPIPWRGLLLAYGAGQLAANLPITPGGLGVVEGSMTVALVAFGGAQISAVTAVLLYRIISFWGPLALGWGAWSTIALRWRYRQRRELQLEYEIQTR